MLIIVELLLFGTGLYLAITGKAGAWVVGKGYSAEGNQVRLAGVVLVLPLPLAFCAGVVIGLIDSDLLFAVTLIELLMVIGSAVIAMVMLRGVRKPIGSNPPVVPPNIEPK
jgi:hypothetical protein